MRGKESPEKKTSLRWSEAKKERKKEDRMAQRRYEWTGKWETAATSGSM